MTFDGPGQQAALYELNIPFRHDWEAILTPVLDAILSRPDVNEDHVALIGVSQAGYAAAKRLGIAHVDPCIYQGRFWGRRWHRATPWSSPLSS
jgi:hypothetical protein